MHRGRFGTSRGMLSFDEKGNLEGDTWAWRIWRFDEKVPLD